MKSVQARSRADVMQRANPIVTLRLLPDLWDLMNRYHKQVSSERLPR